MALGAHVRQVWRLVLRRAFTQLAVGLGLGLIGTLSVRRFLPFVVPSALADPFIPVSITALMVLVTVAACVGPARRATRVDLMTVLRAE